TGRSVALLARPCLEVPGPAGPDGSADLERHAKALAQLGAVALVRVSAGAQPVVDVQRADPVGAGNPDGEVEQAWRVPPSGQHHQHRAALAQQTLRQHPLEKLLAHSSACLAMKISVDSVKPFSRTSAIRSNSKCDPARSTTGRATSTSAPAERP